MVAYQSISSARQLDPAVRFPVRFALRQKGFYWARVLPDDNAYRPIISVQRLSTSPAKTRRTLLRGLPCPGSRRMPGVPMFHPCSRRKQGMTNLAKKLWNDESGQGLAEYALLLGLIGVGVVVII